MIRSDQEYEIAKKIIKELEPMLNQKYRGVVPEEEYMLLWDTIFGVMDKDNELYDGSKWCCMRQEMMGECDCEE